MPSAQPTRGSSACVARTEHGWSGLLQRVADTSWTRRQRPVAGGERAAPRRRILALCLGGIGDTVLAFAALRDLRRACPDDHLTAIAMWPAAADLLRDLGIFDDVQHHNFQKESYWKSLGKTLELRRGRYDTSLLTFPANRFEYNVLARLIGAPRRLGHNYVRGSHAANARFLLTERLDQEIGRHTIDENRALVALATGVVANEPAQICLGPVAPEYHLAANRMLRHLVRPLLGIHPGCTTYKGHAARRWSAERFGDMCWRAVTELGMQPVVFGLPDEIDLKLRIQDHCPEVFLAHGPTIRHTAAMIARCTAFVSNDSGLAHIASALAVPVVMLCGPTASWSIRPYTEFGRVVSANLACSPCFLVGRKPVHCTHVVPQACLEALEVDRVMAQLAPIVAARRSIEPGSHAASSDRRECNAKVFIELPVIPSAA